MELRVDRQVGLGAHAAASRNFRKTSANACSSASHDHLIARNLERRAIVDRRGSSQAQANHACQGFFSTKSPSETVMVASLPPCDTTVSWPGPSEGRRRSLRHRPARRNSHRPSIQQFFAQGRHLQEIYRRKRSLIRVVLHRGPQCCSRRMRGLISGTRTPELAVQRRRSMSKDCSTMGFGSPC